MISCDARVGVDEPAQVVGDRRQAPAAVDQDRHAAVGGELEDRRQPLVVQQELLGTRVELDPARAEVETARRLLDRLLGEIEPHERDQAPARALGVGKRAVVGGAEGRVAVDLVHAEHEAARDPVGLVDPLEVLVDPGHAVDVVAEVDVRVEDLGALRQLARQLVVVAGDQRLRFLEHLLHDLRV